MTRLFFFRNSNFLFDFIRVEINMFRWKTLPYVEHTTPAWGIQPPPCTCCNAQTYCVLTNRDPQLKPVSQRDALIQVLSYKSLLLGRVYSLATTVQRASRTQKSELELHAKGRFFLNLSEYRYLKIQLLIFASIGKSSS